MIEAQLKEVCLAHREGIIIYERIFQDIQHESPKMTCNPKVALSCGFDTVNNYENFKLKYLKCLLKWIGNKPIEGQALCWMNERYARVQ